MPVPPGIWQDGAPEAMLVQMAPDPAFGHPVELGHGFTWGQLLPIPWDIPLHVFDAAQLGDEKLLAHIAS